MAGSVELKLEEYNNDDDAAAAIGQVTIDLDDTATAIADGEYNEASALLDDQINKLQGVKNYLDKLLE